MRKLFLAMMGLALAGIVIPNASAGAPPGVPVLPPDATFNLSYDYCTGNCLGSTPGGTVLLHAVDASTVTITVTLAAGLNFHNTNAFDAFGFNCVGCSGLSYSGVSAGFTGNTTAGSNHEDGAGYFQYVVDLNSGVTGKTSLTFTITGTGVNFAALESTNGGASNVDFEAPVTTVGLASNCTGVIGAGVGTSDTTTVTHSGSQGGGGGQCGGTPPPPPVPEPTSVLLLGTALMFAGKLLKMKLAA